MDGWKDIGTVAVAVAVIVVSLSVVFSLCLVAFAGLRVEAGNRKWLNIKFFKDAPAERSNLAQTSLVPAIGAPTEGASEGSNQIGPEDLEGGVISEALASSSGGKPGDEDNGFMAFITANSLDELDAAFAATKGNFDSDSVEFWTTEYIRRRTDLGAPNAQGCMKDLAQQNPEWAMPFAVLMQWAVESHDMEAAKAYLSDGLSRSRSPQFGHVLSEGIKLNYASGGRDAALSFIYPWLSSNVSDDIKAGMFHTLADCLKHSGNEDGYQVSKELACLLNKSMRYGHFDIAYSYSNARGRWAAAIHHYKKAQSFGDNPGLSKNNLAVLIYPYDKAAAIMLYERAIEEGDKLARANLAQRLAQDGYAGLALKMLDGAADQIGYEENFTSARQLALSSIRSSEDKMQKLMSSAKENFAKYQASVSAYLRNLARSGIRSSTGNYVSTDRKYHIKIEDGFAVCRIIKNSSLLEGKLFYQGTCYSGLLTYVGQSIIGSENFRVMAIDEGRDMIRMFEWPNFPDQLDTGVVELRYTDEEPNFDEFRPVIELANLNALMLRSTPG
ncbi:hypothetical protein ACX40Y_01340 [Sphingomonas sp. RS6]